MTELFLMYPPTLRNLHRWIPFAILLRINCLMCTLMQQPEAGPQDHFVDGFRQAVSLSYQKLDQSAYLAIWSVPSCAPGDPATRMS